MTMPKFDPVAHMQVSVEEGVDTYFPRLHKPEKYNADWWRFDPLHSADQLTEAYEAGKRDAIPEWISANDRLPTVELGGELHCFLLLKLSHPTNSGKRAVIDAHYVNKPADMKWCEDGDVPDWALETDYGEYLSLVGWAEKTYHPDYSEFYTPLETTFRDVVAWMPITYPAAPKGEE